MDLLNLTARYVFPVESPPLPGGVVAIENGRIVSVDRHVAGQTVTDLGNVAILPGLVNAHTHLEFSHLKSPLGEQGMSLPAWLRQVIASRADAANVAADTLRAGLDECLRSGTTMLGEIATAPWPLDPPVNSPLAVTVFRELIGHSADDVSGRLAQAEAHLDAPWPERVLPGVSPHAPYTVHPELLARLTALSAQRRVPLAFHLAESPEEIAFLQGGAGPFRQLLEERGVDPTGIIVRGSRPLDYLRPLAAAHRALVIHGNYLDDEEIAWLAEHRETISVVYCPRTHAYFGHSAYPLAKMLEAGVNVALATDSRASNPDLSLLAEMRHVARRDAIPLSTVLELGTIRGAQALGRSESSGRLRAGAPADLCIVELPDHDAGDPHELVLCAEGPMSASYVRGRVYDNGAGE